MNTSGACPLISIIMPAYNMEKFLEASVYSVLSQTYDNWELLILDDCSTDRTHEIAQSFEKLDKRIRLSRNSRNMGVAKTRNRGLDLAKGDWVALLDSDDVWREDKLEKQIKLATDTEAKLLYTSYALFFDTNGKQINYRVPTRTDYQSMLRQNVIGCSTVMIHRSIYSRFRFQDEIYHEDYALWLKLLRNGCLAAGCPEVLVQWRVSDTSRSFNKWLSAKKRWEIYRNVERLSLLKSISVFIAYTFHGVVKHRRV